MKLKAILFKTVSLALVVCLLTQDVGFALPNPGMNRNKTSHPSREPSFNSSLGHTEEIFRGTNGKEIIFIQDAHDSLEAQQNIARLVTHFVKKGIKTVFEEGYEGDVPTDDYFGFIRDKHAKRKVSFYYLDRLKLGGAEYAHINRQHDFKLRGADDLKAYFENLRLFADAEKTQAKILRDLAPIQFELRELQKKIWTPEAQKWFANRQSFEVGQSGIENYLETWFSKLSLDERAKFPALSELDRLLAQETVVSAASIKKIQTAQIISEVRVLHLALAKIEFSSEDAYRLFELSQAVIGLEKLAHLNLPENEYELLKKQLQVLTTEEIAGWIARTKKRPIVLSKRWEQIIGFALKFYETAKKRDTAAEKILQEWKLGQEQAAILVFGGFHRTGITEILKRQGFSYRVISPRLSEPSLKHQKLYREAMLRGISSALTLPAHAARPPNLFLTASFKAAQPEIESLAQIALQNPSWDSRIFSVRAAIKVRSEMRPPQIRQELGRTSVMREESAPNFQAKEAIAFLQALPKISMERANQETVKVMTGYRRDLIAVIPWNEKSASLLTMEDVAKFVKNKRVRFAIGQFQYDVGPADIHVLDELGNFTGKTTEDALLLEYFFMRIHALLTHVVSFLSRPEFQTETVDNISQAIAQAFAQPIQIQTEFNLETISIGGAFGQQGHYLERQTGQVRNRSNASILVGAPQKQFYGQAKIAQMLALQTLAEEKEPILSLPQNDAPGPTAWYRNLSFVQHVKRMDQSKEEITLSFSIENMPDMNLEDFLTHLPKASSHDKKQVMMNQADEPLFIIPLSEEHIFRLGIEEVRQYLARHPLHFRLDNRDFEINGERITYLAPESFQSENNILDLEIYQLIAAYILEALLEQLGEKVNGEKIDTRGLQARHFQVIFEKQTAYIPNYHTYLDIRTGRVTHQGKPVLGAIDKNSRRLAKLAWIWKSERTKKIPSLALPTDQAFLSMLTARSESREEQVRVRVEQALQNREKLIQAELQGNEWKKARSWYGVGEKRFIVKNALGLGMRKLIERYIPAGEETIDLGSGEGALPRLLGEKFVRARKISAFDINPQFLGRNPLMSWGGKHIQGRMQEMTQQFKDVPAFIALDSMDTMEDLPQTLAQAYQSLKPGGRMIIFQTLRMDLRPLILGPLAESLQKRGFIFNPLGYYGIFRNIEDMKRVLTAYFHYILAEEAGEPSVMKLKNAYVQLNNQLEVPLNTEIFLPWMKSELEKAGFKFLVQDPVAEEGALSPANDSQRTATLHQIAPGLPAVTDYFRCVHGEMSYAKWMGPPVPNGKVFEHVKFLAFVVEKPAVSKPETAPKRTVISFDNDLLTHFQQRNVTHFQIEYAAGQKTTAEPYEITSEAGGRMLVGLFSDPNRNKYKVLFEEGSSVAVIQTFMRSEMRENFRVKETSEVWQRRTNTWFLELSKDKDIERIPTNVFSDGIQGMRSFVPGMFVSRETIYKRGEKVSKQSGAIVLEAYRNEKRAGFFVANMDFEKGILKDLHVGVDPAERSSGIGLEFYQSMQRWIPSEVQILEGEIYNFQTLKALLDAYHGKVVSDQRKQKLLRQALSGQSRALRKQLLELLGSDEGYFKSVNQQRFLQRTLLGFLSSQAGFERLFLTRDLNLVARKSRSEMRAERDAALMKEFGISFGSIFPVAVDQFAPGGDVMEAIKALGIAKTNLMKERLFIRFTGFERYSANGSAPEDLLKAVEGVSAMIAEAWDKVWQIDKPQLRGAPNAHYLLATFETKLKRVIFELLTNAMAHGNSGHPEKPIDVLWERRGKEILIYIVDAGAMGPRNILPGFSSERQGWKFINAFVGRHVDMPLESKKLLNPAGDVVGAIYTVRIPLRSEMRFLDAGKDSVLLSYDRVMKGTPLEDQVKLLNAGNSPHVLQLKGKPEDIIKRFNQLSKKWNRKDWVVLSVEIPGRWHKGHAHHLFLLDRLQDLKNGKIHVMGMAMKSDRGTRIQNILEHHHVGLEESAFQLDMVEDSANKHWHWKSISLGRRMGETLAWRKTDAFFGALSRLQGLFSDQYPGWTLSFKTKLRAARFFRKTPNLRKATDAEFDILAARGYEHFMRREEFEHTLPMHMDPAIRESVLDELNDRGKVYIYQFPKIKRSEKRNDGAELSLEGDSIDSAKKKALRWMVFFNVIATFAIQNPVSKGAVIGTAVWNQDWSSVTWGVVFFLVGSKLTRLLLLVVYSKVWEQYFKWNWKGILSIIAPAGLGVFCPIFFVYPEMDSKMAREYLKTKRGQANSLAMGFLKGIFKRKKATEAVNELTRTVDEVLGATARSEARTLQWLPESEARKLARDLVRILSSANHPPQPVHFIPQDLRIKGISYQLENNLGQKEPFFWDDFGKPTHFTFTRIGPAFVLFLEEIDSNLTSEKITALRKQIRTRLPADDAEKILSNLLVTTPQSYQLNYGLGGYAQDMLLTMLLNADSFLGANVADFGAGNGVLSQLALMLGAEHVWILDNDQEQLHIAKQTLLSQEWPDSKFSTRSIDISSANFENSIQDILSTLDMALINIGAFYGEGSVHRKVLETILSFSKLKKIFNGGMGYTDLWLDQYREDLKKLIQIIRPGSLFTDHDLVFVASLSARSEMRANYSKLQPFRIVEGVREDLLRAYQEGMRAHKKQIVDFSGQQRKIEEDISQQAFGFRTGIEQGLDFVLWPIKEKIREKESGYLTLYASTGDEHHLIGEGIYWFDQVPQTTQKIVFFRFQIFEAYRGMQLGLALANFIRMLFHKMDPSFLLIFQLNEKEVANEALKESLRRVGFVDIDGAPKQMLLPARSEMRTTTSEMQSPEKSGVRIKHIFENIALGLTLPAEVLIALFMPFSVFVLTMMGLQLVGHEHLHAWTQFTEKALSILFLTHALGEIVKKIKFSNKLFLETKGLWGPIEAVVGIGLVLFGGYRFAELFDHLGHGVMAHEDAHARRKTYQYWSAVLAFFAVGIGAIMFGLHFTLHIHLMWLVHVSALIWAASSVFGLLKRKAEAYEERTFRRHSSLVMQAPHAEKPLSAAEKEVIKPRFKTFREALEFSKANPRSKLLVLGRHVRSAHNYFGLTHGRDLFAPPTFKGNLEKKQFKIFLEKIIREVFDMTPEQFFGQVISSDAERTFAVAQAAGKVKVDARFGEVPIYPVSGVPRDQAENVLHGAFMAFASNPFMHKMGDIFQGARLQRDLTAFLRRFQTKTQGHVFLATHGLIINLFTLIALGINPRHFHEMNEKIGKVPTAGLTVLAYDPQAGKWELLVQGDDSYLSNDVRDQPSQQYKRKLLARNRIRLISLMTLRSFMYFGLEKMGLKNIHPELKAWHSTRLQLSGFYPAWKDIWNYFFVHTDRGLQALMLQRMLQEQKARSENRRLEKQNETEWDQAVRGVINQRYYKKTAKKILRVWAREIKQEPLRTLLIQPTTTAKNIATAFQEYEEIRKRRFQKITAIYVLVLFLLPPVVGLLYHWSRFHPQFAFSILLSLTSTGFFYSARTVYQLLTFLVHGNEENELISFLGKYRHEIQHEKEILENKRAASTSYLGSLKYWTIFFGGLMAGTAMWILTRLAPQMNQGFLEVWGLKVLFFTLGHWALMSSGKYLLDWRANDTPSFEKAAKFTLAHYLGISLMFFFVKQFAAWVGDATGFSLLLATFVKIIIDNLFAIIFTKTFLYLNQTWTLGKTSQEAKAWIVKNFWSKYWIIVTIWFPLNVGIYSLRGIAEKMGGDFGNFLLPITTALINYLVWPWLAKYSSRDITYREFLSEITRKNRSEMRDGGNEHRWPIIHSLAELKAAGVYQRELDLGQNFIELVPAEESVIEKLSREERVILARMKKIEASAKKGVRATEKDEAFHGTFSPASIGKLMRVLKFLKPQEGQIFIDLGHGEGSVLFAASALFGLRGKGGELQSRLYNRSIKAKEALAAEGLLRGQVELLKENFNRFDFSRADYIFYYSFGGNPDRHKIIREMKPGAKFILLGSSNDRYDPGTVYADFSLLLENGLFTLERFPEFKAWVFTRTTEPYISPARIEEAQIETEQAGDNARSEMRRPDTAPEKTFDFWVTRPSRFYIESIRHAIQWLEKKDSKMRIRIFYDTDEDLKFMQKDLSSTPGAEKIIWAQSTTSNDGRGALREFEKTVLNGKLYEPLKYIANIWEPSEPKEILDKYGLSEAPLVFANIWPDEIGVVTDTIKKLLAAGMKRPIVIGPRDTGDADEIQNHLEGLPLRFQSSGQAKLQKGILVLDTLGDQPEILRASILAVYGNTLVGGGQSHNLAEANGVIVGKFSEEKHISPGGNSPTSLRAVEAYQRHGAVIEVGKNPSANHLTDEIMQIILDDEEAARLREASFYARKALYQEAAASFDTILEGHYLNLQSKARSEQRIQKTKEAIAVRSGTILISREELAELSQEHFEALYKFAYSKPELRIVIYGNSSTAQEREKLLQAIPGAARRITAALDETAALQKVKPGTHGVLFESKAAAAFRVLPKNIKRARTDGAAQEMALGFYALLEGDGFLKTDANGFYFDPAGWISGQIREFLANQVFASAA